MVVLSGLLISFLVILLASNMFNSSGVLTKEFEITSSMELTGIILSLFFIVSGISVKQMASFKKGVY